MPEATDSSALVLNGSGGADLQSDAHGRAQTSLACIRLPFVFAAQELVEWPASAQKLSVDIHF